MENLKRTVLMLVCIGQILGPISLNADFELVDSKCRITSFPYNLNVEYESALRYALVDYKFVVTTIDGLQEDIDEVAQNNPGLTRPALVYPNPFKLNDGAQLGYQLSKPMDVEIIFYDLFSNEIYREFIPRDNTGSHGGDLTYNKVDLTRQKFNYDLSAGIYFFVIVAEGDVIGRGKFAIKP